MAPTVNGQYNVELDKNRTLFDYADLLHLRVPTSCGRTGECHECIVNVEQGLSALTPPTESEAFLRDNYRLACQARILDTEADVKFSVSRRELNILTDTQKELSFTTDPLTRQVDGKVVFGAYDYGGGVREIGRYTGRILGIAADIGATSVVLNLVDIEKGDTIYTVSLENPQRFGGSDIMNRISYDGGPNRGELRAALLSAINFEIGEMVRKLNVRRRHIYEMVVVGNSTMRDIFFGMDVQPIGTKPYRSVTETDMREGRRKSTVINMHARDAGLRIHPDANVYGGPLIGSHVGADAAACILATGIYKSDNPVLLLDAGTNTEVIVGNCENMFVASCPAGPAFEGGEVKYAMPGYNGAIAHLKILNDGSIEYETIGNAPASGICGSGLIDLLAELRKSELMDALGRFKDGGNTFAFSSDHGLEISRADVSALAQAKAANYCGQAILLREYNLTADKYSHIYLAGGFANYIKPENAAEIGFIPDFPTDKIVKVGNAALAGATMMLLSGSLRRDIEEFVKKIRHMELETVSDFFDFFVEGCQFKPMKWPVP